MLITDYPFYLNGANSDCPIRIFHTVFGEFALSVGGYVCSPAGSLDLHEQATLLFQLLFAALA